MNQGMINRIAINPIIQRVADRHHAKNVIALRFRLDVDSVEQARKQFRKELRQVEKSVAKAVKETEVINPETKQFRWDDRDGMKEYDKIIDRAGKVIRAMRDAYKKYFYEVLLKEHMRRKSFGDRGVLSPDGIKSDPYANKLELSAWDLGIYLSASNLKSHLLYGKDVDKAFKALFAKIRRYGKKAFDDAVVLAESSSYAGDEYDFAVVSEWRGFHFVPEAGVEKNSMGRAIQKFATAAKMVKRAGFGKALSTPMTIYVTAKSTQYSAEYVYTKDAMRLRPAVSTRTIIHEFGHRWYYRMMSSGDRAYWDSVYGGDVFKINNGDVDLVLAWVDENIPGKHADYLNIEDAIEKYRSWNSDDPIVDAKADAFLRDSPSINRFSIKPEWTLKGYWKDKIVGKPVMKNHITDYGSTSPWEAFAELFTHVVIGKSVPEEILVWFRRAVKK